VAKRARVSLLGGVLISAACLWYAFQGVNFRTVASEMGRVGVLWVVASVLGSLLSMVIRAVRWHFLLAGVKAIGARSLISATFIGMMANNVLPARIGELVRAWILAKREQAPVPTVLATILVERIWDVITALLMLGLCLGLSQDLSGDATSLLKRSGLGLLLLVAACVLGLLVAMRFRDRLLRVVELWSVRRGSGAASQGLKLLCRFFDGLSALRGSFRASTVAGLSFVIWGAVIASFYVLAEGFGLRLTLAQTTLVFLIVLFGVAVPSAPGFIGTFHGFCVAGLTMVAGTGTNQAAAYATLLHGSQWIAVNAVGAWFLWSDRVSWAALAGMEEQEPQT